MTKQFHDTALSDDALDQIFREARSYNGWLDKPVDEAQIHAIYELMKMGPTSANMQPARIVWVRSAAAREKLASLAIEGNHDEDHLGPGHRDHRLRHRLPRGTAVAVPAYRREELVRRRRGRPQAGRIPQFLASGRLSDDRRARAGARLRSDVGLRHRCGRPGLLRRRAAPSQPISSARSAMATGRRSSIAARVPNSTTSTASPDLKPAPGSGIASQCEYWRSRLRPRPVRSPCSTGPT